MLVLARSPRAFLTHPLCQTLTEGPIKQLLASVLGVPGADPFSGAYLLSRRALEAIARSEAPRDESFYAEVLLASRHAGCRFEVRIVEGLEWETPDRFQKEIAARGYDEWLADFQNAAQWEYRSRMAALWIDRIRAYMVRPRR